MKIYICVDDTDDLTKSTSTGRISDLIAKRIQAMGGALEKGITRHQLLLHEDIDYTSHNSSMCMVMNIEGVTVSQMKQAAEEVLKTNMAESSDPGLCFCRLDQLREPDRLIAYGKRAQKEIIKKEEAYALAKEIGGTVLEEYGGTGIGVIGALAGVGLRLSGCDGTFRGGKGSEHAGKSYTAAKWKTMMGIEQVLDFYGKELNDEQEVSVDKQLKLAMVDHKKTLIAAQRGARYIACTKQDLYQGDQKITTWTTPCDQFEADNDVEECYEETEHACYNCLFRRWTADGFICVK
ncbi:hypothetical protein NIA71_06115 [Ihubacter massiliensis]|uniref:tRNA(Ile2) 2-agmatinylcytidine synthetase n=1 Tax=Hominibacterium faecale TaxID=2839743 RepID=A0A9J6QRI1_9FIRM|nr:MULTISPECIES: hypothetical protein [Eubacteriales Family XIII. Incertae Sedis]MCO7121529.1 hypothetical protein [Ihubacter massiliensis]MCU7378509.1 hypothetical protein [Hominibacterium faecale]